MTLSIATDPTAQSFSVRRRWGVLLLVLIPVFIGALDLTIVSAILPEMLTKLSIPVDTNLSAAAWAITGYLLAYTVSMTVMGRISDLVGRRGVYLVCLAIFIFGSYWVATSHEWPTDMLNQIARRFLGQRPDLNQLTLIAIIIGRVIQALGAGAMVPVSMALVADLFPPQRRAQPIGLIGAIDTLGWVLGHLYGGVMVNFFSQNKDALREWLRQIGLNWPAPDWHTLFYLNVPIGILAFVLTWLALRGVEHPRGKGRFDFFGAALLALALAGLNLGLGGNTEITGATSLEALRRQANNSLFNPALLVAGALCFLAFLAVSLRLRDPLIDLRLFRRGNVAAASATNLLVGFCLMLGLVSVALLVNLRAENPSEAAIALAAEQSGILLSALTVPMALFAIPGGWLASRVGYRVAVGLGMVLAFGGMLLAGLTWRVDTPGLVMAGHMILVGIGLGMTISPVGTAVINDVDESQRGMASALVIIVRLVGMTVAISSLMTYALNRVAYLVSLARESFPAGLGADEIKHLSFNAYFNSGVQVIDEMLIIGAVACLLALIPALALRGSARVEGPDMASGQARLDREPLPGD